MVDDVVDRAQALGRETCRAQGDVTYSRVLHRGQQFQLGLHAGRRLVVEEVRRGYAEEPGQRVEVLERGVVTLARAQIPDVRRGDRHALVRGDGGGDLLVAVL